MQLILNVLKEFDVKQIWMSKAIHTTKTFETLLDTIEEKGLKIKIAKGGTTLFDYGDIKAEFIAPNSDSYKDLNDYSAVLKLTYKEKSFLFMGDAENISEQEILNNNYDISADVLKVGHHGSSSSSTIKFVETVKPKYAVISVGKGNSYNHPTDKTLATLKQNNIQIYRTDLNGTITAISDGINVTLNTNYHTIENNAPPNGSNKTVEPKPSNDVVYITNTGSKYHKDGCKSLSKSKIPTKLSDIDKNKYDACKMCYK